MIPCSSFLVRALLCTAALFLAFARPLAANEAVYWNRLAVDATTRAPPIDPLTESRVLAMVHLAMHDAVNAVEPRYHTYRPVAAEARGASLEAALAAAACTTLGELLPDQRAAFDSECDQRIRLLPDNAARARGLALGRAVAASVLRARAEDGAAHATPWVAGRQAGEYRPTAPDFTPAFASHWGKVRPFALTSSGQFRPAPPPAPGSHSARLDLEEVRLLGGTDSAHRTHEQSEIGCFWYEPSTRSWNRIARDVGVARKLDVWEQTRLFALVNVAMADGFIGGFEAKYHYNYWRPATAVREAGHPEWLSYLNTPPVPDYPSTHTVLGAAAAAVLARALGTDFVCFSLTSGEPYPNITRRFWSFADAARENGASRVFCGLHFASAVQAGYQQGTEIGTWVFDHALRPLTTESTATIATAN